MSTVRCYVEAVKYRAHGVGAPCVSWYMKVSQWALLQLHKKCVIASSSMKVSAITSGGTPATKFTSMHLAKGHSLGKIMIYL